MSWRRISALAIEANVDRRTLALLAEAVFAYIDEISALSAEGYAEEQSAAAGEAHRLRRRLALLLLEPEQDPDAISLAAADAGWVLPTSVAALAWARGGSRLRARLSGGALVVEEEGDAGIALIADPGAPALEAHLGRAVSETTVLGPKEPLSRAAQSAERARAVLELIRRGELDASGLVRADDHLALLVTHAEPAILRDLEARLLAPLGDETAASRARLVETLRAWLDHQGEIAAVAAQLHVHPQTIRYRLGRLRERLGDALDDPARRFELTLALRAPEPLPEPAPGRQPHGSRRRRG